MRGETVYVNGSPVDDVLVEPGLARDAEDVERPAGTQVSYTLRFPIAFEGPLHDARVSVRGVELDTLNYADHWNPQRVFGTWAGNHDMTVLVGRALGDYSREIAVVSVSAAVDALGDPAEAESTVYEGPAQARMTAGGESGGTSAMTEFREEWAFVVPWRPAFAELRPTSTRIYCDGALYDVTSMENVDGKSESASFAAVRRG